MDLGQIVMPPRGIYLEGPVRSFSIPFPSRPSLWQNIVMYQVRWKTVELQKGEKSADKSTFTVLYEKLVKI